MTGERAERFHIDPITFQKALVLLDILALIGILEGESICRLRLYRIQRLLKNILGDLWQVDSPSSSESATGDLLKPTGTLKRYSFTSVAFD